MRPSILLFSILSTLSTFTLAQLPNAFNIPLGGFPTLQAGQPITLTWGDLSGSTVTLTLRAGNPGALDAGTVIVSNLPNKGTYTFTPPASTPAGADYSIEISDDQDPTQTNYTPPLTINSGVTASASAASTGSMSSSAATSSTTGSMSSMSSMTSMTSSSMSMSTKTGSSTMSGTSTASSTTSATAAPKDNAARALGAGAGAGVLAVVVGIVAVL